MNALTQDNIGQPVLSDARTGDWVSLLDSTGNRVISKVFDTFPWGFTINDRGLRQLVSYELALRTASHLC